MTWLRDAIERLIAVGQTTEPMVRDLHGLQRLRATGDLKAPPLPEALHCGSLESFARVVVRQCSECEAVAEKAGRNAADFAMSVFVRSPLLVEAVFDAQDDYGRRNVFASASCAQVQAFPFDRYLDAEDFIVRLQTGFMPDPRTEVAEHDTGDLAAVLALAGSLRPEKLTTLEDDGVTQVATVRRTAGRLAASAVKNPVALYPLGVTFDEIAPPRWRLILRLKQDGENMPQLALFKAGDNLWEMELRRAIAAKLELLLGRPVLV